MATSAPTSRYTSVINPTGAVDNSTTSSGSANTGTTGTSTTNTQGTSTTNQTTVNLGGYERSALDTLIQQLLSGGTPAMKQTQQERQGAIGDANQMLTGYSKSAAFADAQGLIAQTMRRALESALPSIRSAQEAAGSSGSALQALLVQDAANKAAESSSALGAKQATDYGNISSNVLSVLERLTQSDPTVVNALTQALNVAKGATSTTNSTTTEDKTATTNSSQNQNTQEQKSSFTDYAPFSVTPASTSGSGTSPSFYGPTASDQSLIDKVVGSSMYNLSQLTANPWSAYSF